MPKTIFERLYEKLDELLGGIEVFLNGKRDYLKLTAPGFMDLSIDRLDRNRISLAHNYVQEGDLMADPDMEVAVFPDRKMAEALSYQQDNLGLYRVVYPEPGKVDMLAKADLNSFLEFWLNTLRQQGFVRPASPPA